jgi:hypothetical protein
MGAVENETMENQQSLQPWTDHNQQYKYNFISADPGAGKTVWIIAEQVPYYFSMGISVMIIVPSIQLADEIQQNSHGKIRAIHSESTGTETTVLAEIVKTIKEVSLLGEPIAIVICEASFINAIGLLQVFEHKMKQWVAVKDEPRDPLNIQQFKISDDVKRIISKFIGHVEPKMTRLLSAIIPHQYMEKPVSSRSLDELDNTTLLKQWIQTGVSPLHDHQDDFYLELNDMDCEVTGKLAVFKRALHNTWNEVLIDTEAFENNVLKYSIFQRPESYSMFAQAIFLKAHFEDSFVYHQWQTRGVQWQKMDKQFKSLASERLRIHYLFDNENCQWSRGFRTKDYQGTNNFDVYLAWIREQLPSGDYVYVANNGYSDAQLDLNGIRMPAECHGLNAYSHHTQVVLAGSYLVNRADEPFYAYYESSTTDAVAMRQTQYHIQQITRTDIRNYGSNHLVNVYVPTIREALALLAYFEKATLAHPDGNRTGTLNPAFKPKWADEPTPSNDYAVHGNRVNDADVKVVDLRQLELTPEEILANGNTKNAGHPQLQFILAKKSDISSQGLDKTHQRQQYDQVKESLPYVSVGIFNDGDRLTVENCQGAKMMAFDLDDTILTDKQLAKVMKRWEYIRYTTFSHEDGKLDLEGNVIRRIRIIAPYNRVITISEHNRIVSYFTERLFNVMHPGQKMTQNALKASSIDIDKSKPYMKLFVPHAESNILWVKRKNNRRTVAIDVDEILAQVPPLPKIMLPTLEDIIWKSTLSSKSLASVNTKDQKLYLRCMNMINQMHPGNRSNLAVKVAGIMQFISSHLHQPLFDAMRHHGVSKRTMRMVVKYASGKTFNRSLKRATNN